MLHCSKYMLIMLESSPILLRLCSHHETFLTNLCPHWLLHSTSTVMDSAPHRHTAALKPAIIRVGSMNKMFLDDFESILVVHN